jgi:hypothetical protein
LLLRSTYSQFLHDPGQQMTICLFRTCVL